MGARPTHSDDDLDLPARDGEDGEPEDTEGHEGHAEDIELGHDEGDALDDATAGGDPAEALVVEGAEGGWLVDAEDATNADVGGFDLSLSDEGRLLEDDDAPGGAVVDEELAANESTTTIDGGEEGPLADDEELREEDLPALDADDDGEVADEALYDRSLIADDELRWVDRAFTRTGAGGAAALDDDDSGVLAMPSDDPDSARDATWRRFEASGQLSAAALIPGGAVVVALAMHEHSVLVRILPDGSSGIIAEIARDPGADDEEETRVTSLRWSAAEGVLLAAGAFGVQAFKPA